MLFSAAFLLLFVTAGSVLGNSPSYYYSDYGDNDFYDPNYYDSTQQNTTSKFCDLRTNFKCDNGTTCVSRYDWCGSSAKSICRDKADVGPSCANYSCPLGKTKCSNGLQCVDKTLLCDGVFNCDDGSDERTQWCKSKYNCAFSGRKRCPLGSPYCTSGAFCDGNNDCYDGSDEDIRFCKTYKCPLGQLKCKDGSKCIGYSSLCNGQMDCTDGSDESTETCSAFNCSSINEVKCPLGGTMCLPSSDSLCDGFLDCLQGAVKNTDEDPTFCHNFTCPTGKRKCSDNLQCLPESLFCDGKRDCNDGSDESVSVCKKYNCTTSGRFNCPNGSPRCIQSKANLCDGTRRDCPLGADENSKFCLSYTCQPGYTKCADKKTCVPKTVLCDGFIDCPDGSDERPATCMKLNCSSVVPQDKCPNSGVCTYLGALCNGKADCPGAADEQKSFCKAHKCPSGSRKCSDGLQCLPLSQFCNGVSDCMDGSDESESECKKFNCNSIGMTRCPLGVLQCTSVENICTSGQPSCPNATDQDTTFCKSYKCPPGFSKCSDGVQCLPESNFCDGSVQCIDGSDESASLCSTFKCGKIGKVNCPLKAPLCIARSELCNGEMGVCPNNEDENPKFCSTYRCPYGFSKCANKRQCIPESRFCDGVTDCNDKSDERTSVCLARNCTKSGRVHCSLNAPMCVKPSALCDGNPYDCPNNVDENPAFCSNFTRT